MRINRRAFARLSLASGLAALLGGCKGREEVVDDPASLPVEGGPATPTTAPRYREAPMLAERVRLGQLPPVDERLPAKPLVLEPNVATGQHGGDLCMALYRDLTISQDTIAYPDGRTVVVDQRATVGGDAAQELDALCRARLLTFSQELTLLPGRAESWEYNEDATELTFHLRTGVRWSDGAPYTTEDILFYVNYQPGRAPGDRLVAADDYTFTFRMDHPDPRVVINFAVFDQQWPAHYLKPYHTTFADDALTRLAAERQAPLQLLLEKSGMSEEETWRIWFEEQTSLQHPSRPVLGPWQVEGDAKGSALVLQRNPYYWQIDPDGNQLPYLDRIVYTGAQDPTAFRMAFANGLVGLQALELSTGDLAWLREHQVDGNYSVRLAPGTWHLTLHLNLATPDERLGPLFNDLRVRQALMLAIDRQALNVLHYDGLCTPRQFSPLEGSRFYDERLSTAYVSYDPDEANRLLDEAGYGERDEEGYRLHPDGERVAWEMVSTTQPGSAEDECALGVVDYLADLGIECTYRRVQTSDFYRLLQGNAIQATWMAGYSYPLLPLRAQYTFLGFGINSQPWASAYGYYWYATDTGESQYDQYAVEPPEDHWIRDLWRIYEQMAEETDQERWDAAFRTLLETWAAQVPLIGVLGQMPQPVVVHNDLGNYLDGVPYDPQVGGIHLQGPQQFYWQHPSEHVGEG